MTLKSTLLPLLVFLSALAFASGPTIKPVVSPTSICAGDTVTVAIITSDTFATGTVFYVQLSDSAGTFSPATVVDSVVSQGNDTIDFVAPTLAKNSSHYKIRVVSSTGTTGLDSTALVIHHIPTVSFQLPQSSYCSYAYTIPLSGGSPAGGVYSGNYVVNSSFQEYLSDTGTFEVYYTVTDTVGIGCFAEDSTRLAVVICTSPSVSEQVSPAAICPGSTIAVNIQTSGVLGSDNVFTIQLSDSTGSFANPTVLATDSSPTGGIVSFSAPTETAGTHYEIRVIASVPPAIGVPFNVSFRNLLAAPAVQLDTTGMVSLCTRDSFKLSVDSIHGVLYQWTFDGSPITVLKYAYMAKDSGLYVVTFTDTLAAGCSSGADSVFIGVYHYPSKPTITPDATVNLCGAGPVTLATAINNAVTFQWLNHGQAISGATGTSYAAPATGVYLVEAINNPGNCATKSDSVHVNIASNPVVTFTLPFDSFCTNSAPIALSGGMPSGTGGSYSGNFTSENATFDPAASGPGSFEIVYTYRDNIGCSGSDSTKITVFNCTTNPSGIQALSNQHVLEIYPNPASGNVNISINTLGNCKMRVYNLLGQEVGSQLFNQQLTYSVEKLPAGVYMVEISDVSDSWKSVKRLVVQ